MNEVVITGQYKPESVKNSVFQVRTISSDQIKKLAAPRLQDILVTQLNLRFSQDLATGGTNLNMLGLSGQNVKILLDGVPMIGRQGTSNEVNINQIDVHTIERIEIIEGPMSVIYGADALAGVINIITRKKTDHSFKLDAGAYEESAGREFGFSQGTHNQHLLVSGSRKRWFASGGIARNLFNGWKGDTTGRELTWNKKRQFTGHGVLGYHTAHLNVYYRFDGLDELITNPGNFLSNDDPALDQDYITSRAMQQLQAALKISEQLTTTAALSYTAFTRQVYSTLFYANGDKRVATAPGLHSLDRFNGLTFRASAVYKPSSFISFQPGIDINQESGDGERLKQGVQSIQDVAGFITSEINFFKKVTLRPGIRFIKNSVYDAPPAIPSLNAKLALDENLDFRIAYATGFRAPSLRELYYDFFDANHSILGNPDLQAEKSRSITGSLSFAPPAKKGILYSVVLSGFYNDVKNMIGYTSLANTTITSYTNIDEFKTRGASIETKLRHKNITGGFGAAYTGRYNYYAAADKSLPEFKWSSELNGSFGYAVPKAGLNLNLFYKYTGKLPFYTELNTGGQNQVKLAETSAYHWADFTLNKKIRRHLLLNCGIRNIFDVVTVTSNTTGTAHTATGALSIGYGRSYFGGLNFLFEK